MARNHDHTGAWIFGSRPINANNARPNDIASDDALDRVTVVLVTHNAGTLIDDQCSRLTSFRHVIVVDDQSGDDTLDRVRRLRPDARIVETPVNAGYGFSTNLGIAGAKTEYVLQINPDAAITAADAVRLVATADANPNAAGVAPLLAGEDGRAELAVMGPHERHHRALGELPVGPFCTWFVMAAAVLWRVSAVRGIGGFDPSFFMYEEDADFSLRATRAGYALIVDPEVHAIHGGGGSERPSMKTRWRKDWNQAWSHFYYEDKHGAPGEGRAKAAASIAPTLLEGLGGFLRLRPKTVVGQFARCAAAIRYVRGGPSWGRPKLAARGALPLENPLADD